MSWLAVRVRPSGDVQTVIDALFEAGAQGVHDDNGAVATHFPPETDVDAVRAAVVRADPAATFTIALADATDWSHAWRDQITAHDLGGITVAPPWLADGLDPATTVVIDPGMAFGTGEHPTTRGVLRLLRQALRPGDVVADLGAGSAVLAIAAVKLGAARAAAIENDPDATPNAEENVARNGLTGRVQVIEGDAGVILPLVAPVRLLLANIISSVLVTLLPAMAAALATDGQAIISGILQSERQHMLDVLGATGWTVEAEDAEDAWWTALIARR